jgi:hypothetical protein
MGNLCVLLIVVLNRQEICIHRFYVSAAGFVDHRLQRREPFCVPLEREQLSIATSWFMVGKQASNGLAEALTFPLFPSRALR